MFYEAGGEGDVDALSDAFWLLAHVEMGAVAMICHRSTQPLLVLMGILHKCDV